jgi:RimJ/RimL family protein N-acetyltransferase
VIRLVPVTAEHLPLLRSLVADPAVRRFTRLPVPTPPDFPERWLAGYVAGRKEGTRIGFAVVDEETGEQLGMAVAPTIEPDAATAELGYVVAPSARGRGVATAALGLLTDWALSELGMERLELRISVDNVASKTVAERCATSARACCGRCTSRTVCARTRSSGRGSRATRRPIADYLPAFCDTNVATASI